MEGQKDVSSPKEYIEALDEPRRSQIVEMDALIREAAPELTPHVGAGMLAYGPYHYRSKSGLEGEWFVLGLASNKRAISFYVSAGDGEHYLVEDYADRLGKVSLGRSCVRFSRVEDLHRDVVVELIQEAVKVLPMMPGITITG